MIVTLRKGTKKREIIAVSEKIKALGYKPYILEGKDITVIGMIGEYAEKYKEVF